MSFELKIVKNGFPGAPAAMKRAVTRGMDDAKGPLLADMQRRTPVDTGELRGSETAEVSGQTLTLRATAPHSAYVHEGTRYVSARPFMRDAVEQGIPGIVDAIAKAADAELR